VGSSLVWAKYAVDHELMVLSSPNVLKHLGLFFIEMRLVVRVILNFFAWENKFSNINARCFGLLGDKIGQSLELVTKVFAVLELLQDYFLILFVAMSIFFLDPLRHIFHASVILVSFSTFHDFLFLLDVLQQLWF